MNNQYIFERRPDIVQQTCNAQFTDAAESKDGGRAQPYLFTGNNMVYCWPGITSRQLLKPNGLAVLDVGSGHGNIVHSYEKRGHGNIGVGVTAFRYNNRPQLLRGDAQSLLNVLKNSAQDRPYQVVMSQWLLCHLVEPLGTLEQMANCVDKGGTLVVDRIPMGGDTKKVASACLSALIDSGHFSYLSAPAQIASAAYGMSISGLHLKRNSSYDELVTLPVDFAPANSIHRSWKYVLI
jgi:2-polyprenyl-3-methyl-5-hydroxy-6-metoxy-1,4-benzoquinol methylase